MKWTVALFLVGVTWLTQAAEPAGAPPVTVDLFKPVEFASAQVVGNGTPESITEEVLQKALDKGGAVTFNTGGQPVTVKLSKPLVATFKAKSVLLDGKGLVTLDGGGKVRIFQKEWKTELTVQRLKFQHGRAEKEGAAIYNTMWDGRTTVIDCQFEDCKTTLKGPDIGGGAIRVTGQKNLIVSGCNFADCEGSNGGAICTIGCQMTIVGCSFLNCRAFGEGGGADVGPTGHGGIGGAIYVDGVDQNADKKQLYVGDCYFKGNTAGVAAGAIFGYTRPDQKSLSVYYNDVFENNAVDEIKGVKGSHGGALYSMYCDLYVSNCTFNHNKTPGIGGGVFTALMIGQHYSNCEFYGNVPEHKVVGENISMARRDMPPAVAALGRMPGFQDKHSASPKPKAESAKLAAAPAPKKEEVVYDAKLIERWDAKLREQLAAALKEGKAVSAYLRPMGPKDVEAKYAVASSDENGIVVDVQKNLLPMKWTKLTLRDKALLARGVSSALERADTLATAGMFLVFSESASDAEDFFARAAVLDAGVVQAARAELAAK